MSLRLAVATEDFGSHFKRSIAKAAKLAVEGVRLNARSELDVLKATDSALRQILLYVTERQMNVAGLSCPTKHALYEQEFLEPRLEIIRKSMSLVGKLQTKELIVRCGSIPDSADNGSDAAESKTIDPADPFGFAAAATNAKPSPAKEFSTLCEILNDLAAYGNHVGCVLQLQLTDFNVDRIQQLLNAVTTGPLSIVFDPATAVMTGADENERYRTLHNSIGYVRARDAVRNVDGAGTEVAVGSGVVDWVTLLPTLIEADYHGWVCVERTGGDSRAEDVKRGITALSQLMPQTGS